MKKIFLITLLSAAMIVTWSLSAWALLIPQMTTEELVTHANTIVAGRCLSFHYHPAPDGKTLYAIIQFKVNEYLKNNLGEENLTLMQIAREEGPDGTRTPSSISFTLDEEAVLFLTEEDNEGFRHVVGLPQGKFAVRQNWKGERILVRDLTGVQFFNRKTGEISKVKYPREEKALEPFRRELKQIVSQLKAKKQELLLARPQTSF